MSVEVKDTEIEMFLKDIYGPSEDVELEGVKIELEHLGSEELSASEGVGPMSDFPLKENGEINFDALEHMQAYGYQILSDETLE